MQVGDVFVTKVTGAYAVILDIRNDGKVWVRMASGLQDSHAGYVDYYFYPHELESVEVHLRRNLSEMELKQRLLKEAQEREKKFDAVPPTETNLIN